MGAVNFSLDLNLVKNLKKVLPLDFFVETGTFEGETIECVKDLFSEIHSVELSEEYYNRVKNRFQSNSDIHLYLDSSERFLKKIHPVLKEKSVLYWLDAHWCVADKTAGEKSQCPLLEEIKVIKSLNDESVIVIDDARLFISPPPQPHEISHWPDFESVMEALKTLSKKHNTMILNDTIIFYPVSLKETMRNYAHNNSIDWLLVLHKTRDYDNLQKQFDGLHLQFANLLYQLKEKEEKIFSLSDDLKIKEETIFSLSDDLKIKEEKLITLSDELKNKEKEIVFLSESLNILKKRLSTPIWGLLTLFQHHFPGLWEFIYKKKNSFKEKKTVKEKVKKMGFFTPRLGKLYQYKSREVVIPAKYYQNKPPTIFPKLTIVTPSFNHALFLERTITSVLNQKYPNMEYILQDGGSNDGSLEIIEKYKTSFTHWISERDNGQTHAINNGFRDSTGDIMAWLNSDDTYSPGTFNYIVNYFNAHPSVDVVYGHRILIDENDHEIGRWILPPHDSNVLYYADFIPQETLFWRRRIWEKVGGKLNEEFNFALDWDLLLRFQQAGAKIVRLPRFLASFRVHPQQKTSAQISSQGEEEMSRIREKYLGRDIEFSEIRRRIFPYLLKSELLNKLYQLKLLRY